MLRIIWLQISEKSWLFYLIFAGKRGTYGNSCKHPFLQVLRLLQILVGPDLQIHSAAYQFTVVF